MNISEAQLRLCPDEFVTMRRIEFRAIQKTHPIVSLLRQIEEGAPGSLFGYIVEDSAPPRCSSFDGELVASSSRIQPVASSSRAPQPVASSSRTTFTDIPQSAPVRPAPRLSSALPLPGEQRTAPAFDPADAITFPHGTYDVVLILDTREVESRNNRDKIAEALAAKNVAVETRALRLGDMCWVARRRDGHGGEEDECVLDYVVERKRLDDLCSSIRDGRYKEQCVSTGYQWWELTFSSASRSRGSATSSTSSKTGRWRRAWRRAANRS